MVTEKTFPFHFAYKEEFLPTKRHKALRCHFCEADMDVKVEERDEADFPVAGIVRKNNFDGTHADEAVFRYAHGRLWEDSRYVLNTPTSIGEMPVRAALEKYDSLHKTICVGSDRDTNQGWNPQKSIVMGNDKDDVASVITERASRFIFFRGRFWRHAGEPYYTSDTSAWGKAVCVSVAYCFPDGDPSLETSRNAYAAKDRPLLDAEIAKLKAKSPETDAFFSEEIEVLVPEAFHYGERAEAAIRSSVPKILSQTAGDFLRTLSIWGSTSKFEEYLSKNLGDAIIRSMKEDGHPFYKFSRMDASKALLKLTDKLCHEPHA